MWILIVYRLSENLQGTEQQSRQNKIAQHAPWFISVQHGLTQKVSLTDGIPPCPLPEHTGSQKSPLMQSNSISLMPAPVIRHLIDAKQNESMNSQVSFSLLLCPFHKGNNHISLTYCWISRSYHYFWYKWNVINKYLLNKQISKLKIQHPTTEKENRLRTVFFYLFW